MADQPRPRIVVFAGPTATIQNTEPLVTGNQARSRHGLPLLTNPDGTPLRFDVLRAQRLAAPVTVYITQFSAHPLESDVAELYGPPDGYVGTDGAFSKERRSDADVPVYEATLRPEDGLFQLPYMALQADGRPWENDGAEPGALEACSRQPFFPTPARLFEEIDRFGVGDDGVNGRLSRLAEYDFYRVLPSGGYTKGLPAAERTDMGEGDIPPERMGHDFYNYRPAHLRRDPPRTAVARLVNMVQQAMDTGLYAGGVWLEGSPNIEESLQWMNLLIDTTLPICGNSSQRAHGALANDGDRNIVDSVEWILSRAWAGEAGENLAGVVAVLDQQIFTARDVQKGDARPGGYTATGGHGGVIGSMGHPPGGPVLTFAPTRKHTHRSAVNLRRLPASVTGLRGDGGSIVPVTVAVKDAAGWLLPGAIPQVRFVKSARYLPSSPDTSAGGEVEILARIERNLAEEPLAGFVAEGTVPNGGVIRTMDAALHQAAFSGMPVVQVGRGNAEGIASAPRHGLFIGGSNLTATKARVLLMACLMKLGSLPLAADPCNPTTDEVAALKAKVSEYQTIFDTH